MRGFCKLVLLGLVLTLLCTVVPVSAGSKVIIVAPNALECPVVPDHVPSPVYPGYLFGTVVPDVPTAVTPSVTVPSNPEDVNLVILMYHRISDSYKSDAFTISSALFESDIKMLSDMGYTFCKAKDLKEATKEKNKKIAVITFDDGYESDYTIARPILEKYNACATFFVIGSTIGKEGYMTEEQVLALSRSDAAEIGNHSYQIHEDPYEDVEELYETDPAKVIEDFKKNQEVLKRITGQEIKSYSFPYGIYKSDYIQQVMDRYGITRFCSVENIQKKDPYGRFNRPFDVTLEQIFAKIKKTEPISFS